MALGRPARRASAPSCWKGYSAVIDYPINVGGRPLGSWPAFVPPAVEMAVLGAVLFGVVAMLTGNGLPRLHHPLFEVPEFERASADGFFLLLRSSEEDIDASEDVSRRHSRPSRSTRSLVRAVSARWRSSRSWLGASVRSMRCTTSRSTSR